MLKEAFPVCTFITVTVQMDSQPGAGGIAVKCGEKGVYKIRLYRNTFSEEMKRRRENAAARENWGTNIFLTSSRSRREL